MCVCESACVCGWVCVWVLEEGWGRMHVYVLAGFGGDHTIHIACTKAVCRVRVEARRGKVEEGTKDFIQFVIPFPSLEDPT